MREGLPQAEALWRLGADGWPLFATRFVRLFACGLQWVVFVLYVAGMGLADWRIGLLLTMTLDGDTVVSLWLTTTADRVGRRRMLIAGTSLMVLAGHLGVFQRQTVQPAAPPWGLLPPGLIDDDPPHGFGRGGEEVAAAVPVLWPPADQAEAGLMNQGGGLERLPRLHRPETDGGQLPEFVVDEREQLLRGPGVALVDGRQDAGDVRRTAVGTTRRGGSRGVLGAGVRRERLAPLGAVDVPELSSGRWWGAG